MSQIRYENVRKEFPGGTLALEDFSLAVRDGEFLILVGPSGCGKTTALRLLAVQPSVAVVSRLRPDDVLGVLTLEDVHRAYGIGEEAVQI